MTSVELLVKTILSQYFVRNYWIQFVCGGEGGKEVQGDQNKTERLFRLGIFFKIDSKQMTYLFS
jgi:hypothetical protein